MRTSWTVILASVVLASSGCGGKSFGGGDLGDAGDEGGSSSGGSGSGSGSSSSGSGGSSSGSGGSSSGSGGSSSSGGGSGSSSGGGLCPASPGEGTCFYGEQCNYGSDCNETACSCSTSGQWECTVSDCACPSQWPQDLPCNEPGFACDYPTGGGSCGSSCTCVPYGSDGGSYAWSCVSPPCPPPSCPPAPPQPGDACSQVNESCDYAFDAGCGGEYCTCEPSGTWLCAIGDCVDAGPPLDAGTWGG